MPKQKPTLRSSGKQNTRKSSPRSPGKQNTRKSSLRSTQSSTPKLTRSQEVTNILSSESRLSPFWASTPTSGWNEEAYFVSASFQDLLKAQNSLFNQYDVIKNVLSGFSCPEYDYVQARLINWKVQFFPVAFALSRVFS